jgi:hypothetical protein
MFTKKLFFAPRAVLLELNLLLFFFASRKKIQETAAPPQNGGIRLRFFAA